MHTVIQSILVNSDACHLMFSGEMFIPLYTGEVIDILGSKYQWDSFRLAIFFMALFSLGRSVKQ